MAHSFKALSFLQDQPLAKRVEYILAAVFAVIQLCVVRFVATTPQIKSAIFLGFVLMLVFLVKQRGPLAINVALAVTSFGVCIYNAAAYNDFVNRPTKPTSLELVLGFALLLLVLEATRRTVGLAMPLIASIFIAYALLGPYLPGLLWHRGFSINRFISLIFLSSSSIFGTPLATASTTIFLFILMGEMLLQSGADVFFTRMACKFAGKMTAGPPKLAVIASAMFGMVSGSSAANVVTTGQITIPLMKKAGYDPEFAGAVEAVASTGGGLVPPIMAAGAFLIAEFCAIPYMEVAKAAIIPSIIYYLGLYVAIHYEFKKRDLTDIDLGEEAHQPLHILNYYHLLLPIILLLVLIVRAYPVNFIAFYTIALLIVLSVINPKCDYTWEKFINSFANGMRNCLGVGSACACAGIIVGVITTTGLGVKISALILRADTPFMLALFLTMVIILILGMGLPGIAAYIVGASVTAPILIQLGVSALQAHMFVFYFSNMAVLTPPVALTAYAAAGLAGGDPFKTGLKGFVLAISGFIVPFIFVQEPALLLQGSFGLGMIWPIFTAMAGVFGLTLAIVGYFKCRLNPVWRLLLGVGGLLMIDPGRITDFVGLVLVGGVLLLNLAKSKKTLKLAEN